MAAANRTASSPRRCPRRLSRPPTAARYRPTRAELSPSSPPTRRSLHPGSVLRLCRSWRSRELQPNCWITPCSTVTSVTDLQTLSVMPKSTQTTLGCRWSPPMGMPFSTLQPAGSPPSSGSNSPLKRSSSQRCGPAAASRSIFFMWPLMEQEDRAVRGTKEGNWAFLT